MKIPVLIACFFTAGNLFAQQKLVTQAIVNATTTIVAPDETDDVANIQQNEGGNRITLRSLSDGETRSVTFLKNDLVKTVLKSEMGRSTIIRDNAAKKTTTLIELMGNKTGFYITDEDAENRRKRADSMMNASKNNGDSIKRIVRRQELPTEIVYVEETKKIAGYACKKAYLVSTGLLGIKDTSTTLWYNPELKLNNITNVGGASVFSAIGGEGGNISALNKIDGFVMSLQSKLSKNRTLNVEVTKIELNKEIADKEFEIPKDFDIKPMSEMRNMFQGVQGGGQIRMLRAN